MEEVKELNEVELIERIVAGEKHLYEHIVRKYNPYLYKIGRSYNYNHETTEDLMQDTFVDAYKNLSSFEKRSSFKTWLIRIMLNNCYRKNKKSSFKNEVMSEELDDSKKPMFASEFTPADKLIQQQEVGRIIEEALNEIPFKYRIVFSMREINELNVAETADLLEISESNVKARLSRAKGMLRDIIGNSYEPQELYEFNLVYCTPMVKRVMDEIEKL